MTKARPLVATELRLIGAEKSIRTAVRMGEWVFTPASIQLTRTASATLHDKDRCITLRYSASLLEDLLTELGSIEADFTAVSPSLYVRDGNGVQRNWQPFHA